MWLIKNKFCFKAVVIVMLLGFVSGTQVAFSQSDSTVTETETIIESDKTAPKEETKKAAREKKKEKNELTAFAVCILIVLTTILLYNVRSN